MARSRLLTPGSGERLLASKLQILNGTGSRRPGMALAILTGQADLDDAAEAHEAATNQAGLHETPRRDRAERRYAARTVYLAERHLRDIDSIIQALEQVESKRLNRSAVLRRAVEQMRTLIDKQLESPIPLENE